MGEDATLLGSTNLDDYSVVDAFTDGRGSKMGACLVAALDVSGVGIEGPGTIDGRGKEVLAARGPNDRSKRPFLIRFVRVSGVNLRGVHLQHSAAWLAHFFQCRDVTADNVTIRNHTGSNNDGFDIDSCENVRIRNCDIDSGDDAVCLKTTSGQRCRNIEVSGCTLKSRCAAIKMGTESAGDFETIRISDCHILEARLAGIKLLSVDGASVRDVKLSNITMDAGKVAVFLRLGARLKTFRPDATPRPPGSMRDISIRNLKATVDSPGIMISGIPDHRIEGVSLEDVVLRLPGGGRAEDSDVELPEVPSVYPEIRMFGPVIPAYGAYIRHAERVSIRKLRLELQAADGRPAMACVDTNAIDIAQVSIPAIGNRECRCPKMR